MRMTILAAGAALSMALTAGCGDRSAPAEDVITVPEADYAERLAAMDERQRNAVFLRAIRDGGRPCQQVTTSASEPAVSGMPAWSARCEDGGEWIVAIGRDGVASVINVDEARAARMR